MTDPKELAKHLRELAGTTCLFMSEAERLREAADYIDPPKPKPTARRIIEDHLNMLKRLAGPDLIAVDSTAQNICLKLCEAGFLRDEAHVCQIPDDNQTIDAMLNAQYEYPTANCSGWHTHSRTGMRRAIAVLQEKMNG